MEQFSHPGSIKTAGKPLQTTVQYSTILTRSFPKDPSQGEGGGLTSLRCPLERTAHAPMTRNFAVGAVVPMVQRCQLLTLALFTMNNSRHTRCHPGLVEGNSFFGTFSKG